MTRTVTWFDLIISSLIATSVILVGRAIISYEVFTGRTLPRRGFLRQWRSVVIFAAGYGVIIGWTLTFNLRPIYSLLLTTILMILFYALFSWRSYDERERYISQLRPFVTSQRLYDHLLTPAATPPEVDAAAPFRALCREVLGVQVAYLAAVGPLAPLVGPPLVYPPARTFALPALSELTNQFTSLQTTCISIDPKRFGGAIWAIPLWSERGLIGILLLGEKLEGGLYTQEEMEIARASGERLIDTQASAEVARRLMDLQRQRLAESQVIDRRTRRTLHDDILPGLHTAMLSLSSQAAAANGYHGAAEAITLLAEVHHQISDLLRDMPATAAPEVSQLGLIGALRRYVLLEVAEAFDEIVWQVEPPVEAQCRHLPALAAEVIFYAAREGIRNAARYGRGADANTALSLLMTAAWEDDFKLIIEDNGVGLSPDSQSNGGSGHGLALHSTLMAVIGGSLLVESAPGAYMRVTLVLPQGKVTEWADSERC
jgi:signal transduction histidine kinase